WKKLDQAARAPCRPIDTRCCKEKLVYLWPSQFVFGRWGTCCHDVVLLLTCYIVSDNIPTVWRWYEKRWRQRSTGCRSDQDDLPAHFRSQDRSQKPAAAHSASDPTDRAQHRDVRIQRPGLDRSRQEGASRHGPGAGLPVARLDAGAHDQP